MPACANAIARGCVCFFLLVRRSRRLAGQRRAADVPTRRRPQSDKPEKAEKPAKAEKAADKGAEKAEKEVATSKEKAVVTYGPTVPEGTLVFGVCHLYASFNDPFVVSALSRCRRRRRRRCRAAATVRCCAVAIFRLCVFFFARPAPTRSLACAPLSPR